MRSLNFKAKLILTFILLTFSVLIAASYLTYKVSVLRQKSELRDRILGLAKLSAELIDVDKLIRIKPELASQGTEGYRDISGILKNIQVSDPLIDSVYIMTKSDIKNSWIFLVDSGDKRKVSAYCGERYDVSRFPQMQAAFDGPAVDKELTQDKWGEFLSGYAPLRNKEGRAVAIIGIDVRAGSIRNMQLLLTKRFIFILITSMFFSIILGWVVARRITRSLDLLTAGVREVGKGNLDKKVEIGSKDELGELAGSFNKMTDELKDSRLKLERHYLSTVQSLARIIEAKDPYTRGHSERVAEYAVGLAQYLGFPKSEVTLLEEACILHDIGKIGVPESILTKPGPLTDEEWEIVRTHPKVGEDILKFFEFLQPGMSIIRDHHERQDGHGYPSGLTSVRISKMAAIVSVADAYDAMTSDRSYRKAFSKEVAMQRLIEGKNKQFDPEIVDSFTFYLRDTQQTNRQGVPK